MHRTNQCIGTIMSIEVEYHCKNCNIPFVVYHTDDNRNKHCVWCKGEITVTGIVRRIEGEDIVKYKDGIEISRKKK